MQQEGQDVVPPAPKIIHFVWAGGADFMPEKSLGVVLRWLIKNPDFTLYLWIDVHTGSDEEKSALHYDRELQKIFYNTFAKTEDDLALLRGVGIAPPFVCYESKENRIDFMSGKIIIKDISRYQLRHVWVAYFIELLKPNYGASSDLLRCPVLFKFGGAYFDSDVGPGPTALGELPIFKESGPHRILVEDFTQVSVLKAKQIMAPFALEDFSLDQHVGNDTFGCTKNNPLMNCFFDFSVKRLREMANNPEHKFALCYGARDIKYLTVYTTGPQATRDCINFYPSQRHNRTIRGGLDVTVDPNGRSFFRWARGPLVEVNPIRCPDVVPVAPLAPTHNWLKAGRRVFQNVKEIKSAIASIVLFEYNNFKIFRIDDHIEDLIEISRFCSPSYDMSEEEAFDYVCKVLPIERRHVRENLLCKVTGKYETTVSRFSEFLPKTVEDAKRAVSCMAYWGPIFGYFIQEQHIEDDFGYVALLKDFYRDNNRISPSLAGIFQSIVTSLDAFAVYCAPNLPFFSRELETEVKALVLGYLQKYLGFVEKIIAQMPQDAFANYEGMKPELLKDKIALMMKNFELVGRPTFGKF